MGSVSSTRKASYSFSGYATNSTNAVFSFARRVTILVVDDEASITDLLVEVLGSAGYRVLRASNGHLALAIASRERPALILSDRNMPEVDGFEFVRLLHASPRTCDIPVVLMSSLPLNTTEAGNVAFLAKPFDLDDVLDIVALYVPIA